MVASPIEVSGGDGDADGDGDGDGDGLLAGCVDSSADRWMDRSGTLLMGAPSPSRRVWPSVSRGAGGAAGGSATSLVHSVGVSNKSGGAARRGFERVGTGSTSAASAVSSGWLATGATTGRSMMAARWRLVGRGEDRASRGAA